MMLGYQPNMHAMDKEWGWTPLHYAAHTGSIELCAEVMDRGGDVYKRSVKEKNTPLMIAELNEHKEVIHFLCEFIFEEPAQCITPDDPTPIWLGDKSGTYPLWCSKIGFGAILSIYQSERPRKTYWLDDEYTIKHKIIDLKDSKAVTPLMIGNGEEEEGEGEWELILTFLKSALEFIDDAIREERVVLIHCDDGVFLSPCVLVIWLCTRKRMRINDAVEMLTKTRRDVKFSKVLARNLKKFQDGS